MPWASAAKRHGNVSRARTELCHCQADHIEEWWRGGKSNAENGRLLCRYHHRLRSEGWQLTPVAEEGESKRVVSPPRWFFHDAGAA
jgi:HNH endonuclease